MAIATNAIEIVQPPVGGDHWMVSHYSTDLSAPEDLKAAVSGKCHYVRKIQILAEAVKEIAITIGAGQDNGITTIYLGPIPLSETGGECLIDFGPDDAMKVAVGTALSIDASAACRMTVLVWGKTTS